MTTLEQDRQGFLGDRFRAALDDAVVGIVGLSGGGSHIVLQLAHLGFLNYRVFDPKGFEAKHLHRLVGAHESDVALRTRKTEIAKRTILAVRPTANVVAVDASWTEAPDVLRGADLVFGCVDTFVARIELETLCRRYLIPYIDIGMAVRTRDRQPPRVLGQVALSLPGAPCLRCLQVIVDADLTREADDYGAAGVAPQVVWSNGVLASTAVGIGVQLLSGWRGEERPELVLRYEGNSDTLAPCSAARALSGKQCPHHSLDDVGDPRPRRLVQ